MLSMRPLMPTQYKHRNRQLIVGDEAHLWIGANGKEIARLAQGRADGSVQGTNTMFSNIQLPYL